MLFRTEHALALWAQESLSLPYGTPSTAPYNRFGLHEVVQAPDPVQDWQGFYGVGSGRNRDTILRGKWNLKGSIPDIKIRQGDALGELLALAFGQFTGGVVEEGLPGGFDPRIPALTMAIAMKDITSSGYFIRRYTGGKINRLTLSASEGEELRVNIDEMIFKDMGHNRSKAAKYDSTISGVTDPGQHAGSRFLFSGATITFDTIDVARVKKFTLTINNQLEPKWYISNAMSDATQTQVLSDLVEGKREYTMSVDIDVFDDRTDLVLFDYLMNQGDATKGLGPTTGLTVHAVFNTVPGEGTGRLEIFAGAGADSIHPGVVVTDGNIGIPAPPTGLFPSTWNLNLNTVSIIVP